MGAMLTEKQTAAVELKRAGFSIAKMSRALGISQTSVKRLLENAQDRADLEENYPRLKTCSTVALNALRRNRVTEKTLLEWAERGELETVSSLRCIGKKSYREICEILGYSAPQKESGRVFKRTEIVYLSQLIKNSEINIAEEIKENETAVSVFRKLELIGDKGGAEC